LLRRLPAVTQDLGRWHRVVLHRDCHVQHDRAFYSAPFTLVGKTLWLRATDTVVALYEDYRHVCTHLRAQRAAHRHRASLPEAQAFFARPALVCPAAEIGPVTAELVERLLSDRIVERRAPRKACCGLPRPTPRHEWKRLACARSTTRARSSAPSRPSQGRYDAQPLSPARPLACHRRAFCARCRQLFNPEHH
jgi:hypothetical protein